MYNRHKYTLGYGATCTTSDPENVDILAAENKKAI